MENLNTAADLSVLDEKQEILTNELNALPENEWIDTNGKKYIGRQTDEIFKHTFGKDTVYFGIDHDNNANYYLSYLKARDGSLDAFLLPPASEKVIELKQLVEKTVRHFDQDQNANFQAAVTYIESEAIRFDKRPVLFEKFLLKIWRKTRKLTISSFKL